jgi:hypothetical protein
MTTTSTTRTSTTNPVRSDLGSTHPAEDERTVRRTRPSKAWAVTGVVAGVTSLAGGVASGMVNVVYREELVGDEAGILAELGDFVPHLSAFHVLTTISALAMVVFGLGLARRLRAALPADSLLPAMAAFGLLGTSVVQVMGTSLDTEFIFGVANPAVATPSAAVMYNHWIGTVPWCLVLVGLSALATYAAARHGALPRWFGRVGLVLGGLSIVVAVAPLQYMAAATGGLWILVTAIGFTVGDRAFRAGQQPHGSIQG